MIPGNQAYEKVLRDLFVVKGDTGMRKLFELREDGIENLSHVFSRPSVRGIIIRNGRVAMVESRKYHYWKFPGGGIEEGETLTDTLIREVREEAGLKVIPESIREYGHVLRMEESDRFPDTLFKQENYYFLCDVEDENTAQDLDDYEREESFTLHFVEPGKAIHDNRNLDHGPKERNMIIREAMVLEMLVDEGLIG